MTIHLLLFVLDVSLNFMELFSKKATGLERHAASLSSSETQWQPNPVTFLFMQFSKQSLSCSNSSVLMAPSFCFQDQ